MESLTKLCEGKAEGKRGDVAEIVATAVQSFLCQETIIHEALMNSGDLTLLQRLL